MPTNYSKTKCPYCESTNFEAVPDTPNNYAYRVFYLRCEKCKKFLNVLEFPNVKSLIKDQ